PLSTSLSWVLLTPKGVVANDSCGTFCALSAFCCFASLPSLSPCLSFLPCLAGGAFMTTSTADIGLCNDDVLADAEAELLLGADEPPPPPQPATSTTGSTARDS